MTPNIAWDWNIDAGDILTIITLAGVIGGTAWKAIRCATSFATEQKRIHDRLGDIEKRFTQYEATRKDLVEANDLRHEAAEARLDELEVKRGQVA